jgi:hypothetical protein
VLDDRLPRKSATDRVHGSIWQKEPAFLDIVDPTQVPQDLWTRPESQPDRAAIKAALDAGRQVPGASLNVRNSQRLVIRGKSK